ncbi:hypothetical protein BGZ83_003503 [Gryganskiella cystojenkinii]|nr:hypothetical protein BGZ83_003503 [Gryganskiella cystojenkinii]
MLARTGLKYPSKLHCEKVASFLSEKSRHQAILLAKGTTVQNRDNTDTELEFRQESNFLYLTGVQEAEFYLVYDMHRKISYLIAPDLNPIKAIWKGPDTSDKELLKKYDVDRIVRYSGLLELLQELKPRQIHGLNQPEKGHTTEGLEHFIAQRLVRPRKNKNKDVTSTTFSCLKSPKDQHRHDRCKGHWHRPQHDHGPYGDHHGHRNGHHRHHHHHHHHHHNEHHDHHHKKHRHDKDDDEPEEEETTLFEALILARVNKSPIEIALSRESTRITSDAHRLVMKSARAGMFEYQLEALFRYETARQGAKAQAYLPIVGAGVNGAYLHYTRNDTQIKQEDLILIDAACEADGYGSDVTRTFPVSGKFSPEQATIYNIVLDMQNSVIRSMAQGIEWSAMNRLAQKIGIRGLKQAGILVGDETDLVESDIIRVFFPHGLGHLLGLNVHDDGLGLVVQKPPKFTSPVEFHSVQASNDASSVLPPPSSRRHQALGVSTYATPSTKLEPGMLLTVEPGIYFNPAQVRYALQDPFLSVYLDEEVLDRFMSVGGVRIEDVVLILPDGTVDNITTAPKDPCEIEAIVQQGQREYKDMCERDLVPELASTDKNGKKQQIQVDEEENAAPVQNKKKRVGVFKKLIRAIRRLF